MCVCDCTFAFLILPFLPFTLFSVIFYKLLDWGIEIKVHLHTQFATITVNVICCRLVLLLLCWEFEFHHYLCIYCAWCLCLLLNSKMLKVIFEGKGQHFVDLGIVTIFFVQLGCIYIIFTTFMYVIQLSIKISCELLIVKRMFTHLATNVYDHLVNYKWVLPFSWNCMEFW